MAARESGRSGSAKPDRGGELDEFLAVGGEEI